MCLSIFPSTFLKFSLKLPPLPPETYTQIFMNGNEVQINMPFFDCFLRVNILYLIPGNPDIPSNRRHTAAKPHHEKLYGRYNGFAHVRCDDCGHEYLVGFSCKRRHLCPSCHQKRVIEYGEWLCEEILKAVPHHHFKFSIPNIQCPPPISNLYAS